LPEGEAFPECSIQTAQGVKVADVAWVSSGFLKRHNAANPYPKAPEIVVEVLSPGNSVTEMEEKKELYFGQGAQEFWLCDENGDMHFYNAQGRLPQSALAPDFPNHVQLPFA
jgi:Uma2 family endonuclease